MILKEVAKLQYPQSTLLLLCAQGDHKIPDPLPTCAQSKVDPVEPGRAWLTLQL